MGWKIKAKTKIQIEQILRVMKMRAKIDKQALKKNTLKISKMQ